MKVAVIGAGIMGLSTARALAGRGHRVTVFEQAEPGNRRGSTVGRSRIVRQAYPDRFYTSVLLEGHSLWQELEMASGQRLVHSVGLLYIGPRDDAEIQSEIQTLTELRVPHKVLGPGDVATVAPTMHLASDEVAIHTLEAGWADVQAVLDQTARLAAEAGAEFIVRRVDPSEALVDFDRVVATVGPWVKAWGTLASAGNAGSNVYGNASKRKQVGLAVTLQTYGYVRGPQPGPVWIEGFGDHLYGFPSEPGASNFKIGYHTPGPETDPSSDRRDPDRKALSAIKEAAKRRFGLNNPEIVEAGACLYTTTPNDDFKIGWRDERTLIASPCSGHGFKFGPWMGSFLADLVEEKQKLQDWPRWHWRLRDDESEEST